MGRRPDEAGAEARPDPELTLLLASLLAVVPTLPALSAEPEALEGLVVQMATTPGHHLALADYYRNKAITARQEAQQH